MFESLLFNSIDLTSVFLLPGACPSDATSLCWDTILYISSNEFKKLSILKIIQIKVNKTNDIEGSKKTEN